MRNFSSVFWACLLLLNVGFLLWNTINWIDGHFRAQGYSGFSQSYSYIGDDFPFYHPTLTIHPATMTLQESVRYGYNVTDETGITAWNTLINQPGGFGRAHLGTQRRSFLLTFYHQLHCVGQFSKALRNRSDLIADPEHVNHCLQYLRQTLLCSASDTLEKGDFMKRNFDVDRIGPEIECVDWEAVFGQLDASWKEFVRWRELWN